MFPVKANSSSKLAKKTKKVKTVDLLYWTNTQKDGRITHSTIIFSNDKENGKKVLRYGGHTSFSINNKVSDKFTKDKYLKIVILRLRNNINVSWLY